MDQVFAMKQVCENYGAYGIDVLVNIYGFGEAGTINQRVVWQK